MFARIGLRTRGSSEGELKCFVTQGLQALPWCWASRSLLLRLRNRQAAARCRMEPAINHRALCRQVPCRRDRCRRDRCRAANPPARCRTARCRPALRWLRLRRRGSRQRRAGPCPAVPCPAVQCRAASPPATPASRRTKAPKCFLPHARRCARGKKRQTRMDRALENSLPFPARTLRWESTFSHEILIS